MISIIKPLPVYPDPPSGFGREVQIPIFDLKNRRIHGPGFLIDPTLKFDGILQVFTRIGKIAGAVATAMNSDGYNLLCNNGRAAGQLIEHLHFHIVPRNNGDGLFSRWPSVGYEDGKIEEVAGAIRKNL